MKDLAWTRRMATGAGSSMEKKVCAVERTMELLVMIFALRSYHNESKEAWTKYT